MTHEEAVTHLAKGVDTWFDHLGAEELVCRVILGYLEARGAVLADAEPVGWCGQPDIDAMRNDEKPWLEVKGAKGRDFYIIPLHAALSDNPKDPT